MTASFRLMYLLRIVLIGLVMTGCSTEPKNDQKNVEQKAEVKESEASSQSSYIVFFGNSLTAGYGLETGQDFPSLIQEKINALGLDYKVVNAGLSGETTSGGKNRIDWVLKQPVDIFVLELGGNDLLRGLDVESTRENLDEILKRVKAHNPKVQLVIAGMQAPPNMGNDYVNAFNSIYPALAKKHNAALIPFLLQGVGGIDSLNLEDRIHPNVAGQKIVAENVWNILETLL